MESIRRIEIQKVIPFILILVERTTLANAQACLVSSQILAANKRPYFKGRIDVFIRKVSKAFSLCFSHLLRLKACYFHFGTKELRSSSSWTLTTILESRLLFFKEHSLRKDFKDFLSFSIYSRYKSSEL